MYSIHTDSHAPRGAALRRCALLLGLIAVAACQDNQGPVAPVPSSPSLGVNNGGNNRRILFQSAATRGISSMNPDGTDVTPLTAPERGTDRSPAWSPDGKRIAFVREDPDDDALGEIYVMNADGTGLRQLTYSPNILDTSPTWSKDGKRIAFVSSRGSSAPTLESLDIYVMNADGSSVTPVTDTFGPDFDPAWSPDGKQIAFVSARDAGDTGTTDLYVVTLEGLLVSRLTVEGIQIREPSWAPGGKQIAVAGGNFDVDKTDLFVVNADRTGITRVTDGPDSPGTHRAPAWSPDGKQLAFTSTRNGLTHEIYIMNADGKAVTRLTYNSTDDLDPAWNR